MGGTENHLHLLIQIEPIICLAKWIGKIKGPGSHEMNERIGRGTLQRQRGYGAVSFAKRDLPAVLRYVAITKSAIRMAL